MAHSSDANGRLHPLMGIRPGNHTRLYKTQQTENVVSAKAARVIRDVPESSWSVVDSVDILPHISSTFGGDNRKTVSFTINGTAHSLADGDIPVRTSLAEYLRYHVGLTGTKIGCGEGGCGACTVVLKSGGKTRVANACLRPVLSLDGIDVVTTEGLGSSDKGFHDVQSTIAKCDGTQCGMCTPGMVMSIYGYLSKKTGDIRDAAKAESCIQGNLCRCTGYRPIYKAIRELCSTHKVIDDDNVDEQFEVLTRRFSAADGEAIWLNCSELSDVFSALKTYGTRPHRLVVGGTSAGVVKYYPPHINDKPSVYINIAGVSALRVINAGDETVTFGAAVTLSEVIDTLATITGFEAVVSHLKMVAHPQVRDMASWAGNVMIAKTHKDFPSDVVLLLTLLRAKLTISDGSSSNVASVEDFMHGGALPATSILKGVEIPYPKKSDIVDSFKIMRRHMNTHAELNAGFHFSFDGSVVKDARIVIGNVTLGPLVCEKTAASLRGQSLSVDAIHAALEALDEEAVVEGPSVEDPPFAVVDVEYRKSLAKALLYKAWLRAIVSRLGGDAVDADLLSAAKDYERIQSSGVQTYTTDKKDAPVGQPIEKIEGSAQASGEVKYTGELAWPSGTCVGHMVLAKSVGLIASIDASAALSAPGVVGFISADTVESLGASNVISGFAWEIFAAGRTKHVGQFLGMVCAKTFAQAEAAAALVRVKYQGIKTNTLPITMEDALKTGTVITDKAPIVIPKDPNLQGERTQTMSGKIVTTGQKHFYMETQCAFAFPDASGALRVSAATQSIDSMLSAITKTLKMQANQVTLENIRTGGCYGGKANMSAPCILAACIAARSLKVPVLLQLDRNGDFSGLGGRQPNTVEWAVDFSAEGQITGLTQTVNTDCGFDKSGFAHATGLNCYNVKGAKLSDNAVLTASPLNTIMRAPGDFQAAVFIEATMEQVARATNQDPVIVQEKHLTSEMSAVWTACKAQADYDGKRADCVSFNKANRYRKRGVYVMGSQYNYSADWFEKALVTVNSDGSVSLDHTGLENGQGINTKAAQAATHELAAVASDFDMSYVSTVLPHSTAHFSWSGVTPTWGSGTSENITACVANACKTIASRLSKYKSHGTWKDIVAAAVADRVDLSVAEKRVPFLSEGKYPITVAACMSAEIDVLTGETQVLTCDVVHDTGKSLNPAVDVGQIEGAVVQAIGFCLTEEITRSDKDGRIVNNGTWDYKIPSGLDIPIKMNVTLLPSNNQARGNVFGSKMCGEPAMLAGAAAFFAVKDAIYAARADAGTTGWFELDVPASVGRVQRACSAGF